MTNALIVNTTSTKWFLTFIYNQITIWSSFSCCSCSFLTRLETVLLCSPAVSTSSRSSTILVATSPQCSTKAFRLQHRKHHTWVYHFTSIILLHCESLKAIRSAYQITPFNGSLGVFKQALPWQTNTTRKGTSPQMAETFQYLDQGDLYSEDGPSNRILHWITPATIRRSKHVWLMGMSAVRFNYVCPLKQVSSKAGQQRLCESGPIPNDMQHSKHVMHVSPDCFSHFRPRQWFVYVTIIQTMQISHSSIFFYNLNMPDTGWLHLKCIIFILYDISRSVRQYQVILQM